MVNLLIIVIGLYIILDCPIDMIRFFVSKKYFDTFFITQKELRKLKLNKIQNGSRKDL